MNKSYISKFKQAIEHNLQIANWKPSDNQICSIARSIYQKNYEPNKCELLKIIKLYYNGEILFFVNEGIDNSDLITLLNLATQVTNNAH